MTNIDTLIELKLASGLSGADRRRDLGNVQELIRVLGLEESLAGQLDLSLAEAAARYEGGCPRCRATPCQCA